MAELVPALRGPDGLVANFALHRAVKLALESEPLLHTLQSTVTGLIVDDEDRLGGVTTWEGVARRGGLTALCIGSFFKARLSIGTVIEQQGRLSEMAYDDLYLDLRDRGVEFDARQFSLTEGGATPPYTVTTPVLAAGALAEDGFSVLGFSGLFAAGACVALPAGRPPGYEETARQGVRLGMALVAAARLS